MVDVSVIIVTFNTCALTCAAIRSVQESRGGLTTEIFVVDNASTDDTAAVIAREFPTVNYYLSTTNLGFARANNHAARRAAGEFVLLLNSDARLQPESLATAVAWMRAQPDAGIAGAQLLNPDGSWQNSIANFPTLATELLNKSLLRRLFPRRFPGKEQRYAEPMEVESVIGAFLLVRKKLWDEIGGLDERFFFFFEETDFCRQVQRRGFKVEHLPQVQVWHEQGSSAKRVFVGARIEYWRSRYSYFQKNHGRAVRLVLGIGLSLRLLVDWLVSGVAVLVTAGCSSRWRDKFRVCSGLLGWHLRGCSAAGGIPR